VACSALRKLEAGTQQIPNATADAHPAMAHLYIANPLSAAAREPVLDPPPMEERIARLEAMAGRPLGAMETPRPQASSPWGTAPRRGPWAEEALTIGAIIAI